MTGAQNGRRRRLGLVLALLGFCFAAAYLVAESLPGQQRVTGCAVAGCTPAAPLPKACALLSTGDVASAFGAPVAYRTAESGYNGCTWSGLPFGRSYGHQVVTVDLARVSKAAFAKAYSRWIVPGPTPDSRRYAPTQPVHGVGEIAFTENNQTELEVWYRGTVLDITTNFVSNPLAHEKQLARNAIAALERLASET